MPSTAPINIIMPHIKTYKVIPWTIDHKVLNPIYRVTVRYNPKNIKMIIAINGPLKIRKKMKLFSGKYQYPRRIENDVQYPGEVKVVMIRENRYIHTAG